VFSHTIVSYTSLYFFLSSQSPFPSLPRTPIIVNFQSFYLAISVKLSDHSPRNQNLTNLVGW
jgi:hypothetical protein